MATTQPEIHDSETHSGKLHLEPGYPEVEVVWDPGEVTQEVVRTGGRVAVGRQELQPLEQVHHEDEHLVPGQWFSHAVPLPHPERHQPVALNKPADLKGFYA